MNTEKFNFHVQNDFNFATIKVSIFTKPLCALRAPDYSNIYGTNNPLFEN